MKLAFRGIIEKPEFLYELKKHYGGILKLAKSPRGFVAVGTGRCNGGEYRFALWDVRRKKLLYYSKNLKDQVRGLDFSPSGSYLAVGINDEKVIVYDVSDPRRPVEVLSISSLPLGRKSSRVKFYDEYSLLVSHNRGVSLYRLYYDRGYAEELRKANIGRTMALDYSDGLIAAGTGEEKLYLLNENGDEIFSIDIGDDVYSTKIVGRKVYVGADKLYEVDVETQEKEELYSKGDVEGIDYSNGSLVAAIYEDKELVFINGKNKIVISKGYKFFDAIFFNGFIIAAPECSGGESPILVYKAPKLYEAPVYIEVSSRKPKAKGIKKIKELERLYEKEIFEAIEESKNSGLLSDFLALLEEEGLVEKRGEYYYINSYISPEVGEVKPLDKRSLRILLGIKNEEAEEILEKARELLEEVKTLGASEEDLSRYKALKALEVLAKYKDTSQDVRGE